MRAPRLISLALLITSITSAHAADRVRIAVLGLFHPKQLIVYASPSSPLLVDSGRKQFVAGVGAAQRIMVNSSRSHLTALAGASQVQGEKMAFSARSGQDADFVMSVPGKIRRHYRGKLLIISGSRELIPIVEMDLETAVASVVAAELPADSPLEAQKAQAIVSRSYLVSSTHRHPYADFCDTTHCQFLREPPPARSRAAIAARDTTGLVIAWKGQPIPAMFSASCGGRTHSLAEVGYATEGYPYYSVDCPYCRLSPERWSSHLNLSEAGSLSAGDERSRIKTARKLGWKSLQSNNYTQSKSTDGIVLNGVGRGHGVGLCQRGAAALARSGKDFRFILAHYFPNTTIQSLASSTR